MVEAALSDRGSRRRWHRTAVAARDTAMAYATWLRAEARAARPATRAGATAGRHALVVATSLPPRFDGGVFRPLSWLKYASENGWRISAVTRSPHGAISDAGLQLLATIPADVPLHCAGPLDLRPSHRLFQQVDGGFLTALSLFEAGLGPLSDDPPSVVVATGPSFASFVAGRLLAKRFRCRLVLDYRDEWSENPFDFVQHGRDDRVWESRCLRAADVVQFTTASQLRHARQAFPGLIDGKGEVLLNGWEPDPEVAGHETAPRGDGRLAIAFSGVLGTMGSPAAFLDDLAGVLDRSPALRDRLQLRFIGRRLDAARRDLAGFRHPQVLDLIDERPRAEADGLIRRADALLLLSNAAMSRYLPGKLFEYLATGRPILVHGDDGEAPSLVRQLGAGMQVGAGDRAALAAALDRLARVPPSDWDGPARREWIGRHTRRALAATFFDRLRDLVAPADGKEPT